MQVHIVWILVGASLIFRNTIFFYMTRFFPLSNRVCLFDHSSPNDAATGPSRQSRFSRRRLIAETSNQWIVNGRSQATHSHVKSFVLRILSTLCLDAGKTTSIDLVSQSWRVLLTIISWLTSWAIQLNLVGAVVCMLRVIHWLVLAVIAN